jgi:pimeloyl-ACP methyl ester carboxylesterase
MDLPGRAGDPTPAAAIRLATHANAICAVARRLAGYDPGNPSADQNRKVILVGHSTTGVFISQAAEYCPEAIKKLVYVSAFLPRSGQSAAQLQAMGAQYGSGLGPYVMREPPYVFFKAGMTAQLNVALFNNEVPVSVLARVDAMLVPEPMRPLGDPVSLTDANFGSIPRDYISFQDDKAIVPAFQQAMYTATPCNVIRMSGSHEHWFADPGGFAQALIRDYGGDVDLSRPPPPLSAFK